jgi:hypothetical protein
MTRSSSLAHRPQASYIVKRNIRTHGEKLARRRDMIADMWSGRHDGRCWTAQEIADDIGIEPHMVLRHLQHLRREGDARAFRSASIKNHKPMSPVRFIDREAAE